MPLYKAAAAALPDNFLSGLELAINATDSDHDIDISVGLCMDSTNSKELSLSSAITKRVDATWAAGTNQGGRSSSISFVGPLWYHIFIVEIAGAVDVIFDTDVDCANGIADHSVTHYRRIGTRRITGSENWNGFEQDGDFVKFSSDLSAREFSGSAAAANTDYSLTLSLMPPDIEPLGVFRALLLTSGLVHILRQDYVGGTPSAIGAAIAASIASSTQADTGAIFCRVDASQRIKYRSSTSTSTFEIYSLGYFDMRGK